MKKNITYQMGFWDNKNLKWKNVDVIAKDNGLIKAELYKSKKYYLYLYYKNSKIMISLDKVSYDIILEEIKIFKHLEDK